MMKPTQAHFDTGVRYLPYPILALTTLAYMAHELAGVRKAIGQYYGFYLAGLIVVMVLIESVQALRSEWRMTWATFSRRDLPFLILGASAIGAANFIAACVATGHAIAPGQAMADVPVVPGVIVSILITDFRSAARHRGRRAVALSGRHSNRVGHSRAAAPGLRSRWLEPAVAIRTVTRFDRTFRSIALTISW